MDEFDTIREEAEKISCEFSKMYKKLLPSHPGVSEDEFVASYPFHPFVDRTVLKLKSNRAFQEVRDELRFLASLVYSIYKTKPKDAFFITTGHVDLTQDYVRGGTISKLQNPILVARLDSDLQRLEERIEDKVLKDMARKVLATIVLSSLATEEPTQRGASEEEIEYALLTPSISPEIIRRALKECGKLHFINIVDSRWVFGEVSLHKIIDDYIEKVQKDRSLRGNWWDKIKDEVNSWITDAYKRYASKAIREGRKPLFQEENIHIWPQRTSIVSDYREPKLIFMDYYLPLSDVIPEEYLSEEEKTQSFKVKAASSVEEAKEAVREIYENYGDESREFKNTVFFLVADKSLLENNGPIRYAINLLALDEMLKDKDYLQPTIGDRGIDNIRQLRREALRDLRPSSITVYRYLVYPSKEGLSVYELGEERRDISNFLTIVENKLKELGKIIDKITVEALITRYWPKEKEKVEVEELINGFYKRPELELVSKVEVIKEAIRRAVKTRKLAYIIDHEHYYGREPLKLHDKGILMTKVEFVTLKFRAIDEETNDELNIPITIDDKSVGNTPLSYEDIIDSEHTVSFKIPYGMEFVRWGDGETATSRTITWDRAKSLTVILKPIPIKEVRVSFRAIDTSTNKILHIPIKIENKTYNTPYSGDFKRGITYTIEILTPENLEFLKWSDNIYNTKREIQFDTDTVLTALLKPIPTGIRREKGVADLNSIHTMISHLMPKLARSVRLKLECSSQTFIKISGIIKQLISTDYEFTLNAIGDEKLGLQHLKLEAAGKTNKFDLVRGLIMQLRDYISDVMLDFNAEVEGFKPLKELLSIEALKELRGNEGKITYNFELKEGSK